MTINFENLVMALMNYSSMYTLMTVAQEYELDSNNEICVELAYKLFNRTHRSMYHIHFTTDGRIDHVYDTRHDDILASGHDAEQRRCVVMD